MFIYIFITHIHLDLYLYPPTHPHPNMLLALFQLFSTDRSLDIPSSDRRDSALHGPPAEAPPIGRVADGSRRRRDGSRTVAGWFVLRPGFQTPRTQEEVERSVSLSPWDSNHGIMMDYVDLFFPLGRQTGHHEWSFLYINRSRSCFSGDSD